MKDDLLEGAIAKNVNLIKFIHNICIENKISNEAKVNVK